MKDLLNRIDKLSYLSRETNGASFCIQHEKSSGLFKVVFTNVMLSSRRELIPKPFDEAIDDAIVYIESNRRPVEIPTERFTMFK